MINTIIISKLSEEIKNLKKILDIFHPQVKIIAEVNNVEEGIVIIENERIDLVIIDFDLFDKDIFRLLNTTLGTNLKIICLSHNDSDVIESIKNAVFNCLRLPINVRDLNAAISKLTLYLHIQKSDNNLDSIFELNNIYKNYSKKIFLSTSEKIFIVKIEDIIHCQGRNNYTIFYLINKEEIIIAKTLKFYSDLLSPFKFIRVQKGHLVNSNYIKCIERGEQGILTLSDNTRIPFSIKRDNLIEKLDQIYAENNLPR